MKADIWMPLHIGDYLSATRRLSTIEHGAYLLLLMAHWKEGDLPDNDADLARMAGLRLDHWRKIAPRIRGFFGPGDAPGTLRQKRLHAEREKALRLSEKRAKAARVRWENEEATPQGVDGTYSDANHLFSNDTSDASASAQSANCKRPPQLPLSEELRSSAAAAASGQSVGEFRQSAEAIISPANDAGQADLLGGVAAPEPKRPTPAALIFREALPKLVQMTGASESTARGFLGKLRSEFRNDAIILRTVQDAHLMWLDPDTELAEPKAWIRKTVEARMVKRADASPPSAETERPIPECAGPHNRIVSEVVRYCEDIVEVCYDGLWKDRHGPKVFTRLIVDALEAGLLPEKEISRVMRDMQYRRDKTDYGPAWFRKALGLPHLRRVA